MSLVDADKDNVQRKAPKINAVDTVVNRMAHKTNQTTYRESGSPVIARAVFMQGGIMWVDSEGKVSGVYMYIPEVSSRPVQIIAREGYDVFEDILLIDRPTV
jgi:hypothetical protein